MERFDELPFGGTLLLFGVQGAVEATMLAVVFLLSHRGVAVFAQVIAPTAFTQKGDHVMPLLRSMLRQHDHRRDLYQFELYHYPEKKEPIKSEQLAEAVVSQDSTPVVISLAVCDGGNQANSAFRVESLAQSLHRTGVPVVVASQLPLTCAGSVVLTAKFYERLFSGQDVRMALHQSRVALFQASPEATHDWLSFVAYVRLPEGYADHLDKVSLEAALASLETAGRWAKHIEDHNIQAGPTFDHVVDSLEQRIDALNKSLETHADEAERREIREEKTGLLGSANKRLAQFFFIRSKADPDREEEWQQKSRQALERARDAYRMDWMAHWNGVQYLALQAVLTGKI
jgi:hypothetical protein